MKAVTGRLDIQSFHQRRCIDPYQGCLLAVGLAEQGGFEVGLEGLLRATFEVAEIREIGRMIAPIGLV